MQRHELWLHKAKIDLHVAERALRDNDVELFECVIFHTQQAAEKALKAYLVFQNIPLIRSHDLDKLLWLCQELDGEFGNFSEHAKLLNPLVSAYRYPSDDFEEVQTPSREELAQAIEAAQIIFNFVKQKLESSC